MTETATRMGAAPMVHEDGTLHVKGATSPTAYTVRHAVPLGPDKVIPIVFVPGIMGSNLVSVPQNPGDKPANVWRPPNGSVDGIKEVNKWKARGPQARQSLLDPDNTTLDENGPILVGSTKEQALFQQRGWGSVHHDSYGEFLYLLHNDLNQTLEQGMFSKDWQPRSHWRAVMEADHALWDAKDMPTLTLAELKKFADHQYPVYAAGYNWLQCNDQSAALMAQKIDGWIDSWKKAGYKCDKVILVSHSMGGMVCRAYAKRHPDKVLGVVHSVQPAIGAPAAYRRIACGAEQSSPAVAAPAIGSLGETPAFMTDVHDMMTSMVAAIMGRTPAEAQPVMGVSPGALELLPCHLHPSGWLKVDVASRASAGAKTILELPQTNPYAEIYSNTKVWYRLIDPALLDPGDKYTTYKGVGPAQKFLDALKTAEDFHRKVLGNYYHPNTYAFYGNDVKHPSYGTIHWEGQWSATDDLDEKLVRTAPPKSKLSSNSVTIELGEPSSAARQQHDAIDKMMRAAGGSATPLVNPTISFYLQPQDASGDGTVAWQSGVSPKGQPGVIRVFGTTGFGHQGAYNDGSMRQLTFHLICKIAQDAP